MPSSIDSLFTEFGPTKYVYFSDNTNVVRRIVMDKTKWPILARDMSIVSRASSGMGISQLNISIGSDGNLLAGTYQFAYRLRNSSSLTTTKWSKFTNPTPVIPQTYVSGTSLNYYGGPVGSETDSSITIKIPISSGETSGTFQLIDVAVVKNNDGTNVQQGTAYVFSVSNSSGATTGYSVKYDGNQSEYELSIDSIVAAESPIETAKTIAEKDSRLLAGNIKYFDRRINDAEAKIIEARTIRKAIDYENPENCSKYVSYFRDEVYRFGISYHDEYGNWSPVKPIIFSSFNKTNLSGAVYSIEITTGSINYDENRIRVAAPTGNQGVSGFVAGDLILFNANLGSSSAGVSGNISFYAEVGKGTGTTGQTLDIVCPATLISKSIFRNVNPTTITGSGKIVKAKGNEYNHSAD